MDTTQTQTLAQYGAIGAMLVVFVSMFVWMFKTLFSRFLLHMDSLTQTLKEISVSNAKILDRLDDNHHIVMSELLMTPPLGVGTAHRRRDREG